jgi:adenosylcobinamide hydrolase
MRYYLTESTLIVKGNFHACSTGTGGGVRQVTSLINHTVSGDTARSDPDRIIDLTARKAGLSPAATFGLLTAVPMNNLCITQYEGVTLFVTAGITHPDPVIFPCGTTQKHYQDQAGTINIICCIDEGMADHGLLDAVITVTEAKTAALRDLGYPFAWTVTDAVIVAAEGPGESRYAGGATVLGRRIQESVIHAVSHALRTSGRTGDQRQDNSEPVFFIHSSIGGGKWVEWQRRGCPYYPCHFQGQRCEYCYCPLYPCHDESLGEWTCRSNQKSRIWSCSPCSLNHQPVIVRHLKRNPQASLKELKSLLGEKKCPGMKEKQDHPGVIP